MKFCDKLQKMRKERNYSQEKLADILNISRQAVSKWESGIAYPETDKLIELSKLFNVSIDYMLNDEIGETITAEENEKELNQAEVKAFEKVLKKFARGISIGVALCILAGAVLMVFSAITNSSVMIIPTLVIAAIGVSILIFNGIDFERQEETYERYVNSKINEQEKIKFNNKFRNAIMIGVAICIISSIPIFLADHFDYKIQYGIAATCVMIIPAIIIFIYYGILSSKYETKKYHEKKKQSDLQDKICGVIMLLTTMIYLVSGFVYGAWHPMWIVFPIGGILCGIVSIITENN